MKVESERTSDNSTKSLYAAQKRLCLSSIMFEGRGGYKQARSQKQQQTKTDIGDQRIKISHHQKMQNCQICDPLPVNPGNHLPQIGRAHV